MSLLSVFLAAGSLVPLALSAPLHRPAPVLLTKRTTDSYTSYTGTGSTPPWPVQDAWVESFENMFSYNNNILTIGCGAFSVPNNSPQEISDLQSAIQTVAQQNSVDPRFVLAIVLQESNGCVRAPTTFGSVANPGLMQDHAGSASCNNAGVVTNPCPADTITAMISQGVAGSGGFGLMSAIEQAATTDVSQYYKAARIYNSGSLGPGGDLIEGGATPCYASDIANRLTGWVNAANKCNGNAAIGSATTESGSSSGSGSGSGSAPAAYSSPAVSPQPATPSPPAASNPPAAPSPSSSAAQAPQPSPSTPASSGSQPASNGATPASGETSTALASLAPGVTTNCSGYYTVQAGDTCDSVAAQFGTTFAVLQQLNTDLDAACSNLWLGYAYCVAA